MINELVNSGFQPKALVSESKPVPSAVPLSSSEATGVAVSTPVISSLPASTESGTTKALDNERLGAAVKKLNEYSQNMRRTLSFAVDESTGRTIISVYDAETDELIRQIPPEDTLQLAEQIGEQKLSLRLHERA